MIRLLGNKAAIHAATAVLFTAVSATIASAGPITFTLTGSGGVGAVGNSLSFSSGTVTVTATAWSYWNPSGTVNDEFLPAALGQWSNGLGVCNAAEISSGGGCSTGGEHQVDSTAESSYAFDGVLFTFNTPVDLSTMKITSTDGSDLDASWYAGTPALGASLNDLSISEMVNYFGVGLITGVSTTSATGSRDVTLSPPAAGVLVSALMFMPYNLTGESYYGNDAFKIGGLTIEETTSRLDPAPVPEPASLMLFGTGLAGLAARARRRLAARGGQKQS